MGMNFNDITFFKTAQGSKYIRLPDGRLRRWKSSHANTGGEDMGLHSWSTQSIFVDPKFEHPANSIQYLVGKGYKIALSKDAEGKMFPMIVDGGQWRPATWGDAYTVYARQNPDIANKVLSWKYSKEPIVGYHVVDFDLKGGDRGTEIKSYHFGSPVSEIGSLSDEDKKLFFPSQSNLQESIRKILMENKIPDSPQQLIKSLPQELKDLLFKQWGVKQNPEWHPEGNTLKHIIVVLKRAYHHYRDDPNMIMTALFHDLGKLDTYDINPKTGQPTAYGHEFKSTDYVEQFRSWIESFEGTDVDEIKYLVQNHMKVKPRTWDSMRDTKKEPIMKNKSFDKLMGFTDKLDGGGTDLKESIRKNLILLYEQSSNEDMVKQQLSKAKKEVVDHYTRIYNDPKTKQKFKNPNKSIPTMLDYIKTIKMKLWYENDSPNKKSFGWVNRNNRNVININVWKLPQMNPKDLLLHEMGHMIDFYLQGLGENTITTSTTGYYQPTGGQDSYVASEAETFARIQRARQVFGVSPTEGHKGFMNKIVTSFRNGDLTLPSHISIKASPDSKFLIFSKKVGTKGMLTDLWGFFSGMKYKGKEASDISALFASFSAFKNNMVYTNIEKIASVNVNTKAINEQAQNVDYNKLVYSAVLGYIDQYSDKIIFNRDNVKNLQSKGNIMRYCESMRDGKTPTIKLTPEEKEVLTSIMTILRDPNKTDKESLNNLSNKGKGINHKINTNEKNN